MRLAFSFGLLLLLPACQGMPLMEMTAAGGATAAYYGTQEGENGEEPALKPVPPQIESSAERIANRFRDEAKAVAKHAQDWWNYDPRPGDPHDVPSSYCYRTRGDVLCYRAPMPGWEHRLIGYQGTYAKAPPPVKMEPLPIPSKANTYTAEERLANATPVFDELPPEIEEEAPKDPAALLEADPQNVQEPIPDPALSPQL